MIRAVILGSFLVAAGCASSVAPSWNDAAAASDSGRDAAPRDVGAEIVSDAGRDTGAVDAGRREYRNDFENQRAALDEWSTRRVAQTPTGARGFLGPIGRDTTTRLTLGGWAAHTSMIVSVTVFVLGTWDGNPTGATSGPGVGPDSWDLRVRGGAAVVHTTFANLDGSGSTQAFPGEYPGGVNPPGTGAAERGTLGFFYLLQPWNSVYRIERRFAHTDPTLVLEFTSSDAEPDNRDEEWGLDEIVVRGE